MAFPFAVLGLSSHWEWLIVLLIFMMLFGVGKLPEVGKKLGEGIKNFKKGMAPDEVDVTSSTESLAAGLGQVASEAGKAIAEGVAEVEGAVVEAESEKV